MALSFNEIKELIAFGRDQGLEQLQTEGLVVVYGQKQATAQIHPLHTPDKDESEDILKRYAAMGAGLRK